MNEQPIRLFDMDGLLVKSEHLAFRGCCNVVNRVLTDKGVALQFTPESLLARFVGQSFRGMVTTLAAEHNFVFAEGELEKLVKDEEDAVIERLEADLEPTDGINEVLARTEGVRAVVSSSALRRIRVSLKKAGQEKYFPADNLFSATSSLSKPTSKPNPAIYKHALEVLGVKAEDCIAYEDSPSGVKSADGAGIVVVGYVGSYPADERDEMEKILLEAGATVVIHRWDDFDSAEATANAERQKRKAAATATA